MIVNVAIAGVDYTNRVLAESNILDLSWMDENGRAILPGATLKLSNIDNLLSFVWLRGGYNYTTIRVGAVEIFGGYTLPTGVRWDLDDQTVEIDCFHRDKNREVHLKSIQAETVLPLVQHHYLGVFSGDAPSTVVVPRVFFRVNDLLRALYNLPLDSSLPENVFFGGREQYIPSAPNTPFLPTISARELVDLFCSAFNLVRYIHPTSGRMQFIHKEAHLSGMSGVDIAPYQIFNRTVESRSAGHRRLVIKYGLDGRLNNTTANAPENIGILTNNLAEGERTIAIGAICPQKRAGSDGIPFLPTGQHDLFFFVRTVDGQSGGNALRRYPISDTGNENGLIRHYHVDQRAIDSFSTSVSLQSSTFASSLLRGALTPFLRVRPGVTPGLSGTHYHASRVIVDIAAEKAELTLEGYV